MPASVDSASKPADAGIERFEPPGGFLVWILVFVELVTFGAGLAVFMVQARQNPGIFADGRALLNQPIALANTIFLLTGGWCMANGITRLRSGQSGKACSWISAAILTGIAFLLLKGIEYWDKFQHGITLTHDSFFTLYYLLTQFHFLHVLVAVILLIYMRSGLRSGKYDCDQYQDIESSAIFWHMCDLIWLLIYPVIYLLD